MRRFNAFFIAGLFSLLFTACKKEIQSTINSNPDLADIAAAQKSITSQSKKLVLETFTHTIGNFSRQYQFAYAPNGNVDSIVVSDNSLHYSYNVFYKGSRIDSVHLVQSGKIVSSITNFQYKGNLITGFDYFDRLISFPISTHYAITYDQQKRISTIDQLFGNTITDHKIFTYNASGDLIAWNETGFSKHTTYTNDEKLNPLHFIPDLFAIMFEEPWTWEYILSMHNITSTTYLNGPTVTYQNQYNNADQLVSKVFTDINSNQVNTFTFTYQ